MSHQVFDDSSFTLKSRANSWVIPPDKIVFQAMEMSPEEVKIAIMGMFMQTIDLDDMDEQACADALIINAVMVATSVTNTPYSEIIRHMGMPYKYRLAFEKIEKELDGTPTSEDLKEMFGA
tara:strand:+ start:307 stop:669 length:363 start_codon:yes stop_codon:yes gene_type:complete